MKTLKLLFLTFLSVHCSSLFSGGACLYEIADDDVRLASAGWAARARDASTTFTNPAGLTRLQCRQIMIGAQPLYNTIEFKSSADTTISGTNGFANAWLPAGNMFFAMPLNGCFTLGLGGCGYFGSSLKYGNKWVGRYYCTSALLMGLSGICSIGYKVTDKFSIGIGSNVMYGFFKDEAAINNTLDALPDGAFKLKKNTWGAGYIIGVLYEFNPCTRLGFQYLSQVRLKFKCTPHFSGVGPTLESYLTDFGLLNSNINVVVKVPQQAMLSFYHDLTEQFTIMADLGWQQWSHFNRVDIYLANDTNTKLTAAVKYQDTFHIAAGVEYIYSPSLTFSTGAAYDSSAISAKNRTFTFPVGKQWRIGTGIEYTLLDNFEFSLGYEILLSPNLSDNQSAGTLLGHIDGFFRKPHSQFIELCAKWSF
jgi:long-chain fatty acid transport protein